MRNQFTRFIFAFVLANCFLSAKASSLTTETGPLSSQLAAAGLPISMFNSRYGKQAKKLEKQLTADMAHGPRLLALIEDFENDVARPFADELDLRIASQMGFANLSVTGQVKAHLPDWAMPIYDYTEGIPEKALLTIVGDARQPYVKVNQELRDPAPDSHETIEWVVRMRAGLEPLPRYEGLSFRGARLTKERVNQYYQIGKPAEDPAFI